ncbi:AMP-binding protein, partial [Bacillus subtilis]|uniref:AMP-binding protein n=2 Tax=Bacillaceae TaxID=186817 RepID=UPI00295E87CB
SELAYLLKQSDTTTLLVMEGYKGTSYLEMLYRLIPELQTAEPGKLESAEFPYLKHIVYLGKERKPGMWLYDDIVKMGDQVTDAALDRLMSELDVDDAINMQYTSGTTGFPKGVMLTHRNLIHNASNIAACMELSQQDRLCIPVPFFHCFGCVLGTLACVSVAATMVPVEEFHPEKVLHTVQAEKCTALHGVPTMFIAELNLPTFDTY